MNDDHARAYLLNDLNVPRETIDAIETYRSMLIEANARQNLIARSTEDRFWSRHVLDSAQLVTHAPPGPRTWVDVGTGAGLPGLVLAILSPDHHVLVEPRRLRAEFVQSVVTALAMDTRVSVRQERIERTTGTFTVITARAFASLTRTLDATAHLADSATMWLLNKGARADAEIAEARAEWTGNLDVLPSITDADAAIVRVTNLRRARAA